MGLKEVLQEHNVPLPEDFDERFDIVISGLKKKPDYETKLNAYKTQSGGAVKDPNDFLSSNLQWFIDSMTTPNARNVLKVVFAIIFFISYLENIPVLGSILSAALDITTAALKSLMKALQKSVPALFGLIPLPFMSLLGMVIASMFGFVVWPIVAMVSFSRQDFTAAIDSILRVVPPPVGDSIADAFLEANKMAGRLNSNRKKLASDISSGFNAIAKLATGVNPQVKKGAETLAKKTEEAAAIPEKAKTGAETLVAKAKEVTTGPNKVIETINAQATAPEGIMNKMGEAKEAAEKVTEKVFPPTVPASQVIKPVKEKISFPPQRVRAGGADEMIDVSTLVFPPTVPAKQVITGTWPRKAPEPAPQAAGKTLSSKPHGKRKWKTRRNKFVKR